MIGKGALRSERVSFHTLTSLKLFGMVDSYCRLFPCQQKCKTVKTLIRRWGKCRGTQNDKDAVRSERVSFHTIT